MAIRVGVNMLQFCSVSNSFSHTNLSNKVRGIFFLKELCRSSLLCCYDFACICVCMVGHGYTTIAGLEIVVYTLATTQQYSPMNVTITLVFSVSEQVQRTLHTFYCNNLNNLIRILVQDNYYKLILFRKRKPVEIFFCICLLVLPDLLRETWLLIRCRQVLQRVLLWLKFS